MSEGVPDGWELGTIAEAASNVTAKYQPNASDYFRYIGLEHIVPESHILTKWGYSTNVVSTKSIFKQGDTLFGKLRPYLKKVAYADFDGVCSTDILVIRAKPSTSPTFLFRVLSSDDAITHSMESSAGNVMPRTSWKDMADLQFLIPPKPEQQKIASILTSVDEVIEKTEAQIGKLQDLKTGMMQELLTKGIGHTEFKASPVGRIPRDWDVKRLRDCCSLMTNGYVGPTREIYRSDGVPYILCQNVRPNVFVDHVYKHVDSDFHRKNKRSRLQEGDLLTVQTGAGNGDTCVVPKKYEDANCHALIISRAKKEILNPFFLCEFLNSFSGRRILNAISTGGAHPHTNTTELRKIRVPVPPIHEQTQIADSLNAAQKVIEDKTASVEAAQKLKRGIMQDLLTGKVRVKVN